jgi:hypothetical protein
VLRDEVVGVFVRFRAYASPYYVLFPHMHDATIFVEVQQGSGCRGQCLMDQSVN